MDKPKYRKKPVEVEASRITVDNIYDLAKWCLGTTDGNTIVVTTLEGNMTAITGDYLIKGIKGEFYPCRSDIFEETYSSVK